MQMRRSKSFASDSKPRKDFWVIARLDIKPIKKLCLKIISILMFHIHQQCQQLVTCKIPKGKSTTLFFCALYATVLWIFSLNMCISFQRFHYIHNFHQAPSFQLIMQSKELMKSQYTLVQLATHDNHHVRASDDM